MSSLFPFEVWIAVGQSDECSCLSAVATREEAEAQVAELKEEGYRAWIEEAKVA